MSQVHDEPGQAHRPEASCSFCRKSYRDVGPLAEGPDTGKGAAYICADCAELVLTILRQEKRRREREPARQDGPVGS
jgi:ATP-dependent Clp protease ATP-binding subunit ClpX